MIGLYNKDIIDLSIPIPLYGTSGCVDRPCLILSEGKTVFLSDALQWNLERCLLSVIFDKKNNVLPKVQARIPCNTDSALQVLSRDPNDHAELSSSMARSFRFFAVVNIFLAPLILVYRVAQFSFRNSGDAIALPTILTFCPS